MFIKSSHSIVNKGKIWFTVCCAHTFRITYQKKKQTYHLCENCENDARYGQVELRSCLPSALASCFDFHGSSIKLAHDEKFHGLRIEMRTATQLITGISSLFLGEFRDILEVGITVLCVYIQYWAKFLGTCK